MRALQDVLGTTARRRSSEPGEPSPRAGRWGCTRSRASRVPGKGDAHRSWRSVGTPSARSSAPPPSRPGALFASPPAGAATAPAPTAVVAWATATSPARPGAGGQQPEPDAGQRRHRPRVRLGARCAPGQEQGLRRRHRRNGCHARTSPRCSARGSPGAQGVNIACSGAVAKNLYRASNGGEGQNGEAHRATCSRRRRRQEHQADHRLGRRQRPRLRQHRRRLSRRVHVEDRAVQAPQQPMIEQRSRPPGAAVSRPSTRSAP